MRSELDLFDEAKRSRILLNIVFAIIVFLVMIILGQTVGGILTAGIIKLTGINIGALSLSLIATVPILLCFLWVKFIEKRPIATLGLRRNKAIINFFKGMIFGLILFTSVILLMYISGVIRVNQGIGIGLNFLPQIILMFIVWVIQGSSEEILTRGWLMNVVGARYIPMVGFILSSVIFGIMHLLNPGINIVSVLNIILVGFMLGLYVVHTKNLWGACGIHAAWNFAQANIYGFNVSGLEINVGSLITFDTQGSELLTGGTFGPEASIFASIVQIVVIVVLVIKLRMENNRTLFK